MMMSPSHPVSASSTPSHTRKRGRNDREGATPNAAVLAHTAGSSARRLSTSLHASDTHAVACSPSLPAAPSPSTLALSVWHPSGDNDLAVAAVSPALDRTVSSQSVAMQVDSDLHSARSIHSLTESELAVARTMARKRLAKALFLDLPDDPIIDKRMPSASLSLSSAHQASTTSTPQRKWASSASSSTATALSHFATPFRRNASNWQHIAASSADDHPIAKSPHLSPWLHPSNGMTMTLPETTARHGLAMTDTSTTIHVANQLPVPAFVFYCCRAILQEVKTIATPSLIAKSIQRQSASPSTFNPSALLDAVNENGLISTLALLQLEPKSAAFLHSGLLQHQQHTPPRQAALDAVLFLLDTHIQLTMTLISSSMERVFQSILAVNQYTGTASSRPDTCIRVPLPMTRRLIRDAILLLNSKERNALHFLVSFSCKLLQECSQGVLATSNLLSSLGTYFGSMISRAMDRRCSLTENGVSSSSAPATAPAAASSPWCTALFELLMVTCLDSDDVSGSIWYIGSQLEHEIRLQLLSASRTPGRFTGGLTPSRRLRQYSRNQLSSTKRRLFSSSSVAPAPAQSPSLPLLSATPQLVNSPFPSTRMPLAIAASIGDRDDTMPDAVAPDMSNASAEGDLLLSPLSDGPRPHMLGRVSDTDADMANANGTIPSSIAANADAVMTIASPQRRKPFPDTHLSAHPPYGFDHPIAPASPSRPVTRSLSRHITTMRTTTTTTTMHTMVTTVQVSGSGSADKAHDTPSSSDNNSNSSSSTIRSGNRPMRASVPRPNQPLMGSAAPDQSDTDGESSRTRKRQRRE
ncbi:hypothetical protein BC831DRAFT_456661 [Entophlyctis helioformis]|nr:hypothetical protein BC831DRAFT_456661 [Entophlyctis helioformis]